MTNMTAITAILMRILSKSKDITITQKRTDRKFGPDKGTMTVLPGSGPIVRPDQADFFFFVCR